MALVSVSEEDVLYKVCLGLDLRFLSQRVFYWISSISFFLPVLCLIFLSQNLFSLTCVISFLVFNAYFFKFT